MWSCWEICHCVGRQLSNNTYKPVKFGDDNNYKKYLRHKFCPFKWSRTQPKHIERKLVDRCIDSMSTKDTLYISLHLISL